MRACVNWDVFVVGSGGSGLTRIALDARGPAWSPDGRRLAYESGIVRQDFVAGGVTITRLDGSGSAHVKARRATRAPFYVFDARWRVPRTVRGRLRFCVDSVDAARNKSNLSCAPLVIR